MKIIGGNSALWQGGLCMSRVVGASPPNLPPIVQGDTATVTAGDSVTIDVLSNDTDPEGGALSVISASADQGSAVVNADGTVSYTAPGEFENTATVTYVVQDAAGNRSEGTVAVTVTLAHVDQPPVAGDDTAAVATSGGSVTIAVLANDTDPEGGALSVTAASAGRGSVVVNADNTLTYTAPQGFSGTDTVTYTVSDPAGHTDEGVVTVSVTPLQLVIDDTTGIGNFSVEAEPGAITLTIIEPVEYASDHVIQTADLAAGPVNLIPPRISGGAVVGGTLSAAHGVWACDEVHGQPAFGEEWLRGDTPVAGAVGSSYVVQAGDEVTGLRYRRQVQNAAGSRFVEVEAMAAQPETGDGGAFSENAVRFTSGSKLVRNADLAAADARAALFFVSLVPFATARQGVLRQTATGNGIEVWDGAMQMRFSFPGHDRTLITRPLTVGKRISAIGFVAPQSGDDNVLRIYSRFEDETGWTLEAQGTSIGTIDLTYGGFTVGGRHGSAGQELNAAVHRIAFWAGATADAGDPQFFARFLKADGTLEDPAVSRDFYGIPRVDLYGSADEYAAGINHGEAGNFDAVEGTFTNA